MEVNDKEVFYVLVFLLDALGIGTLGLFTVDQRLPSIRQ
jgi:hypothetical protein